MERGRGSGTTICGPPRQAWWGGGRQQRNRRQSGRRQRGGGNVGFKPTRNTSFQLDLKLIEGKKVGDRSTTFDSIGRALNNSRGRHSQSLCNMVALGMRLRQETKFGGTATLP